MSFTNFFFTLVALKQRFFHCQKCSGIFNSWLSPFVTYLHNAHIVYFCICAIFRCSGVTRCQGARQYYVAELRYAFMSGDPLPSSLPCLSSPSSFLPVSLLPSFLLHSSLLLYALLPHTPFSSFLLPTFSTSLLSPLSLLPSLRSPSFTITFTIGVKVA